MLSLILENIAYHTVIAIDKIVYLIQFCLYGFRSFLGLFFRLFNKAIRNSIIIAVLIVKENTVCFASIASRSADLLNIIRHADRRIKVYD